MKGNLSCRGPRDMGDRRGGDTCSRNSGRRWYYNARRNACIEFEYRGCGGNSNRYCSRRDCERRCRRRGGGGRDDE